LRNVVIHLPDGDRLASLMWQTVMLNGAMAFRGGTPEECEWLKFCA
jgi:hypothetical protein